MKTATRIASAAWNGLRRAILRLLSLAAGFRRYVESLPGANEEFLA